MTLNVEYESAGSTTRTVYDTFLAFILEDRLTVNLLLLRVNADTDHRSGRLWLGISSMRVFGCCEKALVTLALALALVTAVTSLFLTALTDVLKLSVLTSEAPDGLPQSLVLLQLIADLLL